MRNLIAALVILPLPLFAQTVRQEVRLEVGRVNAIEIHGTSTITIPARRVGKTPFVAKTSATYAITTNEEHRRIVVSIDAPMPKGTTLTMTMAAPKGGSTIVAVPLSTSPQTAVTGISRLNENGLAIEYSLTAAPGSTLDGAATRTVFVTLVSGV